MSTIGIMAIGQTMIIVTGGIDLSVGSVLAASSMLTARLMFLEVVPPWIAVALGLGFGTLLGLTNGLIITKLKVNPFITTLGMLSIARGLTYLLASGLKGTVASNVPMRDEAVNFLGGGYVGPVPVPVIEMIVLVIAFSLFLKYTVLGRQIYAVGSNEQAARLSGVPVTMVKIFVYSVTGTLCALAGIMTAGLLATSATNAGVGIELSVIAAVVIGGASLQGGEGTIVGAVIGAAIIAVLRNAFILLHFPIYMQTITIGVVIILAVATDQLRHRNR
jgi:ribose transport system permease protein